MKATSEQIIAAYRETGSVWVAAKRLGMGGQSVWERLRALDVKMVGQKWSIDEIAELRRLVADCTLSDIAQRLGRPYAGVALMASRLKITTRFGNRRKRKVPRGSGLTKTVVLALSADLRMWKGSIRQFCRARGMSIDLLALAIQKHDPATWEALARERGLVEKICPGCDEVFYPMTAKQVACKRQCGATHKRDLEYFGGRRREAIGMRDGVCQLCLQPKLSLAAHHMLGKENDCENEHLIALCNGCHHLVTIAAARKILDTSEGWERLIELVLARRLAEQDNAYIGTHVSVDVEYLTHEDLTDLSLIEEAVS